MQLLMNLGAALLLALLIASPALDTFTKYIWGDWKPRWFRLSEFLRSEVGAVSVTYWTRGNGVVVRNTTTVITATQAQQVYKQSAVVVFGVTADVQALFTHNWGLDISAPEFYEPEVLGFALLSDLTAQPSVTYDWTNTNVLKINKAATNAPFTAVISLRRPHSMGQ